jgi:hypothetical protein
MREDAIMFRLLFVALFLSLGVPRVKAAEPAAEPFVWDREKKQVTRHDAKGKVVWSVTFDGYIGGVRPPHLVWDQQRAHVTHKDGVTALDAPTGKVLWHTEGPHDGP